ncbi:MAG: hypothetical protein GC186_04980 [Rhodobacteraceae bacterium]|nr:hypothetical protein [Paracoccaceae bacterium]
MDPLRWLLRMSRWSRHPPPARQVAVVLGVVAACLLLAGIEHVWGWPAWATVNRPLRLPRRF